MPREYVSGKKIKNPNIPSGVKMKSTVYITKDCFKQIDSLSILTGKESRSQVIEEAINFYHSYISGEINLDYLCGIYGQKVEALMSRSTDRLSRLLFKLAVNENIIAKLAAGQKGITKDTYEKMRQKAIQEVKATQGVIDIYDISNTGS